MLKEMHTFINMYMSRACIVHPHTYQKADEKICCVILNGNLGTERKIKVLQQSKLGFGRLPQMAIKLPSVDSYH